MLNETSSKSRLEQEFENAIAAHPKFSEIESRLSALESLFEREKPAAGAAKGGEGPLHTRDPAPAYGEEDDEEYEDALYVHDMAAGPPVWMDEDRSETVAVPSRLLKKGERYYVARIRGGSMTGAGVLDGDLVLIRYADVPRDGAIQAVRYQDKVTLKRLRETEGGWELRYTDGSGKAIVCDSDEYQTLGEFVTVLPKSAVPGER